jgi:two-component system OmpR family response regulator
MSFGHSTEYAVMTVDRTLTDVDGIEVIRRLRQDGIVTPALIISTFDKVDDRVEGLRAGADDYLVRPFAVAEMLARVDALARRNGTIARETVLRVGDLEMDLLTRTAYRGGREIRLRPREFRLLECLVRNAGEVVPRSLLLRRVWDLNFDPMTNIIDVYVGRLRRKVDSDQAYPIIHTVRGVGFCAMPPSARPEIVGELQTLARAQTHAALATLIEVMSDAASPPNARVAAAVALLDHGQSCWRPYFSR